MGGELMVQIPEWSLDKAMDVLLDNLEHNPMENFKENGLEVRLALYTIQKEERKGNEDAKAIADKIRELTRKNKEE